MYMHRVLCIGVVYSEENLLNIEEEKDHMGHTIYTHVI